MIITLIVYVVYFSFYFLIPLSVGAFLLLHIFKPTTAKGIRCVLFYQFRGIYRYIKPPDRKCIKGQIVLVTGGAMGIGAITCEKLGQLGAKIVLCDIMNTELEQTVQSLKEKGIEAWGYKCDVTNSAAVYEMADKIRRDVGDVSILFNNAGIMPGGDFTEMSDAIIDKTFQINTISHFWTIKAFLPKMLENNKGHIVTISSSAGIFPVNKLAIYCGTKFACKGMSEALACELFDQKKLGGMKDDNTGIFVSIVCPYIINTKLSTGLVSGDPKGLPILNPENAVEEIVDGVLRNRRYILIPKKLAVLEFISSMLSPDAALWLGELKKTHRTFDNFVGRGYK